MNVLIGTGFWADPLEEQKLEFFHVWLANTRRAADNIVVVNNSKFHLPQFRYRIIACDRNLGHACGKLIGPLGGWSMSWILPALVAYCDGCDFVYKEQDCLAWGDWLPHLQIGRMSFGRNSTMACEQSLFYIRHDAILAIVKTYLAMEQWDSVCLPEQKFIHLSHAESEVYFHDLPGGRDRPLPLLRDKPWYAQKLVASELELLRSEKFIDL